MIVDARKSKGLVYLSMYLYHFKRPSMQGTILYPLNTLKEKYPNTFEDHAKKYQGREVLMERVIPGLNCLWNDVIHLSPVNPQIILDLWRSEGLEVHDREFPTFKIPLSLLDQEDMINFDPHSFKYKNFEFDSKQFPKFSKEKYREQTEISQEQLEVWKKDELEGRPKFWYSHTRHILYRGSIETKDLEVIICK